jgi:hypothetical protein
MSTKIKKNIKVVLFFKHNAMIMPRFYSSMFVCLNTFNCDFFKKIINEFLGLPNKIQFFSGDCFLILEIKSSFLGIYEKC